jgi:hypothetical protein
MIKMMSVATRYRAIRMIVIRYFCFASPRLSHQTATTSCLLRAKRTLQDLASGSTELGRIFATRSADDF